MKLVRLDGIATEGRPLELHPRLTVVHRGGPRLRGELVAAFQALGRGRAPAGGGVIEVNGVLLALDDPTVEQLDLDVVVDPVLVLSDAAPAVGRPWRDEAGHGPATERLRAVGEELTGLLGRVESARAGLDPFAPAALDAARGRIEALERTRAATRAEWEARRRAQEERRRELERELAALRSALVAADEVDPAPVLAARARLVERRAASDRPDPEAAALAGLLDDALDRLRELQRRRDQLELRVREAEQRLAEARAEAQRASASMRSPEVDRGLVERLDAVRDEIFAVDDRAGRLGSGRNKRRLQELRAEQAILLEQLGYDTYSAYVMGVPSTRAELERSARLEGALARVERIDDELAELRAEAPPTDELERAEAELQTLLVRAHRHLGPDTGTTMPLDVSAPSAAEAIYEVVAALRRRRLSSGHDVDPGHLAVAEELRSMLVAPPAPAADLDDPPPALPPLEPLGASVDDLLAATDRWLGWHRDLREWTERARGRERELAAELEASVAERDDDGVARWARVEQDLDDALDALAAAEERVRAHERATELLAALREEELELREAERELLAALAPPGGAPGTAHGGGGRDEPATGPVAPPPYRHDSTGPAPDDQLEWRLVERAARQRRVSFVGSMPLLVIDVEGVAGRATRARILRLSELVQLVVLTDDEALAAALSAPAGGSRLLAPSPLRT